MKTIILKTSLLALLIGCCADCATAMQKCSSVANLHIRDDKSPKIASPEAYIELAEKFFRANYPDSGGSPEMLYGYNAIDDMRNELCSRIAMLYHLVNVFGVKKYTNINTDSSSTSNPPPEVLTIDISWPNLKRVIQNRPEYKEVIPAKPDTTEQKPLTLANLKWILEIPLFSKIGSEKSLEDGSGESGLSDYAIEFLMKLCVGNQQNRVFSIFSTGNSNACKAEKKACKAEEKARMAETTCPTEKEACKAEKEACEAEERARIADEKALKAKEKGSCFEELKAGEEAKKERARAAEIRKNLPAAHMAYAAEKKAYALSERECALRERERAKKERIKIRNALRRMLKNMTGAQRVMSVLAVSILNSSNNTPFVHGLRNIRIRIDANSASFIPSFMDIELKESLDEAEVESDLNHEMTHAYDYMIKERDVELDEALNEIYRKPISLQQLQWLCGFSVMNSNIDFIDEFFPMLSSKNMDPENKESIVFRIKELLKTYSKYDKESAKNIIVHLVKCGFGCIIFNGANADLKIDNFLDPEILAKCIYVYSWICNDIRTESDSLWSTNDEQSTILGKTVWQIGGRCFMVEDRQNEQIHGVRRRNMAGEAIRQGEEHRFHSENKRLGGDFAAYIDISLANILKDAKEDAEYKNRVEEITSHTKSQMEVLTTPSNNKFTQNSTKTQGYRNSTDISSADILEYLLGSLENGKAKNIYPFYWTTDEQTTQQLLAHAPSTALIPLLCRAIHADRLSAAKSCLQRIPANAIDTKSIAAIVWNLKDDALDLIFGDNNSNIESIKKIQEIIVSDPEYYKWAKLQRFIREKDYPFLKEATAF